MSSEGPHTQGHPGREMYVLASVGGNCYWVLELEKGPPLAFGVTWSHGEMSRVSGGFKKKNEKQKTSFDFLRIEKETQNCSGQLWPRCTGVNLDANLDSAVCCSLVSPFPLPLCPHWRNLEEQSGDRLLVHPRKGS